MNTVADIQHLSGMEQLRYNPIGSVHGGYAATLLDTVMGCAVYSQKASCSTRTALSAPPRRRHVSCLPVK